MKNKKKTRSVDKSIYLNEDLYKQCLLILHGKNRSFSSYLNQMMEKQLASFRVANGLDPHVEITKELIDELNEKRKNNAT